MVKRVYMHVVDQLLQKVAQFLDFPSVITRKMHMQSTTNRPLCNNDVELLSVNNVRVISTYVYPKEEKKTSAYESLNRLNIFSLLYNSMPSASVLSYIL